jgi:AcrR family transcriptional regulator
MARSVGLDRAQVVVAAALLANAHGFDALTLAQVAEQVGVKLPSLYNHIAGLPALRRALALHGLQQLLDRLSRAAIGIAGDDAVIALARAYRQYILDNPGVYAATVRAPAPDDRALIEVSEQIIAVTRAVLAHYALNDDDVIHAIRALRAIAHGFATIELSGGFGIALSRDASYEQLLASYVAGLRQRR